MEHVLDVLMLARQAQLLNHMLLMGVNVFLIIRLSLKIIFQIMLRTPMIIGSLAVIPVRKFAHGIGFLKLIKSLYLTPMMSFCL